MSQACGKDIHTLDLIQLRPSIDQVKLYLLKEALHLYGFGVTAETDHEAMDMAVKIMRVGDYNSIFCEADSSKMPDTYPLSPLFKMHNNEKELFSYDGERLVGAASMRAYWLFTRAKGYGWVHFLTPTQANSEGYGEMRSKARMYANRIGRNDSPLGNEDFLFLSKSLSNNNINSPIDTLFANPMYKRTTAIVNAPDFSYLGYYFDWPSYTMEQQSRTFSFRYRGQTLSLARYIPKNESSTSVKQVPIGEINLQPFSQSLSIINNELPKQMQYSFKVGEEMVNDSFPVQCKESFRHYLEAEPTQDPTQR